MAKYLILTLLVVIVYQYDELVRLVVYFFRRIRNKKYKELVLNADEYVGTALAVISLPMVLLIMLNAQRSLTENLVVIAGVLMLFAILSSSVATFSDRLKELRMFNNVSAFAGALYVTAGLFHPVIRLVPWYTGKEIKLLAKTAFYLSLAPILGLCFKYYYGNSVFKTEFEKHIDTLILVMVVGLSINVSTPVIRKYLHTSNLNLTGYVRVLVGLGVCIYFFTR